MNLTLGNYQLSLSKASAIPKPPTDAPVLISMEQPRAPFIFNHYDHPRQNLSFIRETVSACMHVRSEAIGRGTFHASKRGTGPGAGGGTLHAGTLHALSADHPLERLLQSPNPLFDLSDLLELSSQWLDATGNALWLKVRNGRGEVTELWPVAALSYYIERGSDELPSTYRFIQSNIRIPASDIIHIRRADIRTAPFLGHAILSDILETAKADTAIRLFQSRFFENDATPRAVLKWPAGAMLTQDQMDQLRLAWEAKYGSPHNAGKIGILPDGGDVQLLGSSAKELDFAKSKKDLRDTIREAFKVPQIALGDVEGVNLANAETSYMVFMRDVVDYALAKHARALTRALAPEFGEGITIEHESLVPETEERYMARISELKQCITVDEQRALLSLPPLAGGRGNVFLLGNSVVGEDWRAV